MTFNGVSPAGRSIVSISSAVSLRAAAFAASSAWYTLVTPIIGVRWYIVSQLSTGVHPTLSPA